jgi:CxxC motif-containing protein
LTVSKKTFTCIVCPKGCQIDVWEEADELQMTGNTCKRGKDYATNEYYNPSRLLTTTVQIAGARIPLIPVRSSKPVPIEKIMDFMDELAMITVTAPVKMGDVLVQNMQDLEIDIMATRSLEAITG